MHQANTLHLPLPPPLSHRSTSGLYLDRMGVCLQCRTAVADGCGRAGAQALWLTLGA